MSKKNRTLDTAVIEREVEERSSSCPRERDGVCPEAHPLAEVVGKYHGDEWDALVAEIRHQREAIVD